ncbi:Gastric triacylglycerol lipase [Trichinella britovi]|uniref:Gastric triacylglycerol lipase n=1 Tax=Trichinella britovi TaxID=45882 RepID=A0A0V1D9M0_TRIBR|nr:Gastric triacylglycerol lipase [Trichinella britovi]
MKTKKTFSSKKTLICGGGGRVSFKRMKRFIDALDIAYGLIGLPVIEISGFGFQMNQTIPIKSQSPDIILKTVRCWCVHVRARSVEDTGRKDEESERADPGGSRVPIKPVKAAGGSRRRWTRTTRLDGGACCVVISVLKLTTNAGQCRAGGDKSKQQTRLCYNTIPGYHGRLWVFIGAASPDRLIRRQSTNSRTDVGVVEPSPFRKASRSGPIEVFKQLIANRRHLQRVPVAEQKLNMPPEAYLDTCGMASLLRYLCEEHTVVTEDGYILRIHRISNDKHTLNISRARKEPVLLQHGLLQSSIDWVINFDNESLGYLLADAGYDVWLGNVRGNTYGRQHKTLHPSSKLFWTFSFDEMAKYDLKAVVDYIFNKTGKQALHYAGHSQGSLLGFILFSEEPTWAETRIRTFHALAPVAYLGNTTSFIKSIAPISGIMKFIIELFGGYEFLPSTKVLQIIGGNLCKGRTAFLCENIILFIAGYDYKHINSSRLPVYLSHSPAGSSTMNIIHYLQLMNSGQMQKFDFGKIGNLKKYGQISPPLYHAGNVKLPVALYWGSDDIFSVEKDVLHLQSELPNLLGSYLYNETDHLDFVWGLHMPSGPNQSENGTLSKGIFVKPPITEEGRRLFTHTTFAVEVE